MIDKQTDTALVDFPEPEPAPAQRGDWLAWLPWVIALALAGICFVLLGFGSNLRQENNELAQRLADTEFAYSELQTLQTNLQRKLSRVETNYATRVADLQKQVVQKNQEVERQKVEIETRGTDANLARKQLRQLESQVTQNVAEMERLNQQLSGVNTASDSLSETRMGLLLPTPDGPSAAFASAVFDLRDQKGILAAENLTPLSGDRDYQLWLLDPNLNGPVSGGVFRVNERGGARAEYKAAVVLRSPERFAISVERKGGSSAPSGRFVLTSN